MNRTPHMLLILLTLLLGLPSYGPAAPLGNIGDPMLWNPGPFRKDSGLPVTLSLFADTQTNHLPEQMTRFPWTNPNNSPAEERHYSQTRQSKNELTSYGVKMGVPIKDRALIYATLSMTSATVHFHYEDWTVSRSFEEDDEFTSDAELCFGLGTSFIIERGRFQKIPLTLGMDISYRRLSIREDRLNDDGLSYASDLDEIQLAFCLSAETTHFSPYIGVKVASLTGTEDYINKNQTTYYTDEGYVHYSQDITWSKNIGYFMGATTSVKGFLTVGVEFRGGDENAMGINATTKF